MQSERLDGQDIVFDLDGTLIEGDIGETLFYHTLLAGAIYTPNDEKWFLPFSKPDSKIPIPIHGESAQLLLGYQIDLSEGDFEKAYTSTARWLENYPRKDIELLIVRLLATNAEPVRIACQVFSQGKPQAMHICYGVHIKVGMREMVRNFHEKGARLWIVSASPQMVCELVGRDFKIEPEYILGVKVAKDGRQISRFPWGSSKVRVLHEAGVTKPLFAFGDGEGDIEMLSIAKYPVVIEKGSTSLLKIASQKDWWFYADHEKLVE
ncbi:MAG: HAD family hydrolase [Anaerolineaceae bacterium]